MLLGQSHDFGGHIVYFVSFVTALTWGPSGERLQMILRGTKINYIPPR